MKDDDSALTNFVIFMTNGLTRVYEYQSKRYEKMRHAIQRIGSAYRKLRRENAELVLRLKVAEDVQPKRETSPKTTGRAVRIDELFTVRENVEVVIAKNDLTQAVRMLADEIDKLHERLGI